jgi:hypothetical protein
LYKKSPPGYLTGASRRGSGSGQRALVVVEDDEFDLHVAEGGLLLCSLEGAYLADGVALLAPPPRGRLRLGDDARRLDRRLLLFVVVT